MTADAEKLAEELDLRGRWRVQECTTAECALIVRALRAYVNGDSVRLDWMLANSAYRVMGSDERGWRAMDCNDGIVIIGSGKTAREAIDAAMTRRDISGGQG